MSTRRELLRYAVAAPVVLGTASAVLSEMPVAHAVSNVAGRIVFLDEQKAKRENRRVEDVTAESTSSIPVGRYGNPEEYGGTVAFLARNRASYITGAVIRVDGGLINSI